MNTLLFSVYIGIAAGVLDVIPMFAKGLSGRACASAFLQYFFVAIIILNINLPYLPWWSEGAVLSLMLAIPIVIIISGKDKKAVPIILLNAIVLGTLISLAGHYLRGVF